jgi:tight adherence protein C
MSDAALLVVGVSAAFLAALSAAYGLVVVPRSRRPAQVLQAQLQSAGVQIEALRQDQPFGERVVEPFVTGLSRLIVRLTPAGTRDKTAHKLVLAGSPRGWTAERVLALKGVGSLAGGLLGYFVGVVGSPHLLGIFWVPLLSMIGFLLPGAVLGHAVLARQESIRKVLADTIDLLTISVEAGLSFDAALLHVRRTMRGPLSEEIGRMLHEIQLGVARGEAFRHLAARTEVEELNGFVLSLIQADVFGVTIGSVLRAQSREMRIKRRQHAEERSMKVPVKLLFPMIFCILPALLIVVAGPGIIRIVDTLFGSQGLFTAP